MTTFNVTVVEVVIVLNRSYYFVDSHPNSRFYFFSHNTFKCTVVTSLQLVQGSPQDCVKVILIERWSCHWE